MSSKTKLKSAAPRRAIAKPAPSSRKAAAATLARRAKDARSIKSKRILLEAAVTLFIERGYAGFSVNEIVRRTGIAKTTIYRHWPTQSHLLTEAIARVAEETKIPDLGNLHDDLVEYFTVAAHSTFNDNSNQTLVSLAGLLQAAEREPGLIHVVNFAVTSLLNRLRIMLERGRARGEVRLDCDLDTLIYLLFGAMFVRRGLLNAEWTDVQITAIVDAALKGITPRSTPGIAKP